MFRILNIYGLIAAVLVLAVEFFHLIELYLDNSGALKQLTFSIATDPVNSPLWSQLTNPWSIGSTIHPIIGLLPEIIINLLFGYDYIWVSLVLSRAVCIYIAIYCFFKLYKPNYLIYKITICVLVFLVYSSVEMLHGFRISRPHWVPTVLLLIITIVVEFNNSKFNYLIAGLLFTIPLAHDPWLASIAFPFVLFIVVLDNKFNSRFMLFSIGFLFSAVIAYFRIYYVHPVDPAYLEYLGQKYIYLKNLFYKNYIKEVLFRDATVLCLLWIFFISYTLKNYKFAAALFFGIFMGPLPFIFIEKVVQPYHYKIAVDTILFIAVVVLFAKKYSHGNYPYRSAWVLMLVLIFLFYKSNGFHSPFKNRIIEQAIYLDKNYGHVQKEIDEILISNPYCIFITNDIYLRAYIQVHNGDLKPIEGYRQAKGKSNTYENEVVDIAEAVSVSKFFLPKEYRRYSDRDFIRSFLIPRVHNKYSSTDAWMAQSVFDTKLYLNEDVLSSRSFDQWPVKIPTVTYSDIVERSKLIKPRGENYFVYLVNPINTYRTALSDDFSIYNGCKK